jgi:hypothetical protein
MRKRLLLVGLVLLLAVPLALALRTFAREVIVVPVLRILWLGYLFLQSIPQSFLWALLLVAALFISARSLIKSRMPTGEVRGEETDRPGQVTVWARRIRWMTHGGYFEWSLAQHLGRLFLAALAYREQLGRDQIRQYLQAGQLDMPPEIRAYLQAGLSPLPPATVGFLSRLLRRFRPGERPSPLNLDPEQVVRFLEEQSEV